MASAVRKLQVLNGLAQGFLVQLYNIKLLFTDPAIRPKFAHPNNAKTTKAIYSKYPDIPPLNDKVRKTIYSCLKDTFLFVNFQLGLESIATSSKRPHFSSVFHSDRVGFFEVCTRKYFLMEHNGKCSPNGFNRSIFVQLLPII